MKKGKLFRPEDAGKMMSRHIKSGAPYAQAQFAAFVTKEFGEYNKRKGFLPKKGRKTSDDTAAVKWMNKHEAEYSG